MTDPMYGAELKEAWKALGMSLRRFSYRLRKELPEVEMGKSPSALHALAAKNRRVPDEVAAWVLTLTPVPRNKARWAAFLAARQARAQGATEGREPGVPAVSPPAQEQPNVSPDSAPAVETGGSPVLEQSESVPTAAAQAESVPAVQAQAESVPTAAAQSAPASVPPTSSGSVPAPPSRRGASPLRSRRSRRAIGFIAVAGVLLLALIYAWKYRLSAPDDRAELRRCQESVSALTRVIEALASGNASMARSLGFLVGERANPLAMAGAAKKDEVSPDIGGKRRNGIPDQPYDWQEKAPCGPPPIVAINGGCWVEAGTAPCGPAGFEHAGKCFIAIRKETPPPRSEGREVEPR
jgi:hypothetical protein